MLLWAAIRFALWGGPYGITDDETLWQRHNVEAFLVSNKKLQPESWRYQMRSRVAAAGNNGESRRVAATAAADRPQRPATAL